MDDKGNAKEVYEVKNIAIKWEIKKLVMWGEDEGNGEWKWEMRQRPEKYGRWKKWLQNMGDEENAEEMKKIVTREGDENRR